MERNREYPKLINHLNKLVQKFNDWYTNNKKYENRSYYNDKIDKNYLKSISKNKFISFFISFYAEGGKVQSGGERQLSRFKSMINKNYENFKEFVLQPFSDDFNLNEWLIKIEDNNYY